MELKNLIETKNLNSKITLRNPIIMAPMTTFSANEDGTVSDAELSYYKKRAKEVGMVITATTYVTPSGKGFRGEFAAYNNSFLPSLKKLSEAIKSEGALANSTDFSCWQNGTS